MDSAGKDGVIRYVAHFWAGRYHSIVELEAHLHRNGTRIIKFFLLKE